MSNEHGYVSPLLDSSRSSIVNTIATLIVVILGPAGKTLDNAKNLVVLANVYKFNW